MSSYKRLLLYAVPYWRILLMAGGLALLIAGMTAFYAWLVKPAINDVLINRDVAVLRLLAIGIVGVSVVKATASFCEAYLMRYVGNRIVVDLRNQIYEHLLALPVGYYAGQQTGRLMSRVMNDVGLIRSMLTVGMKDVIQHSVMLVVLMGYVLWINWRLALLAVVVLPVAYVFLARGIRRIKRLAKDSQEHLAGLTAQLQESLIGLRVIKSFAKEEFALNQFRRQNDQVFSTTMRMSRLMELMGPVTEVAGATGIALLLWSGGWLVISGAMDAGAFMSFLTACIFMYGPVKRLSTVASQLQPLAASGDRLFEILDAPSEQQTDKGHIAMKGVREGIVFDHVTFAYATANAPALRDVSFRIAAGETVALVGFSGSGKSTVVNLLARFYEPTSGRILIDGVDLTEITLISLRQLLGMVGQETVLFYDTVRNNIAYGRNDIGMDAVERAARAAYAHEFILELPHGYDTVIGERGLSLSGGERQRLAISRAFLIDPPILILDEATSSLDYESEAIVQRALVDLIKGRTTVVIAHRLSTVQQADCILVLDDGQIVEQGTHQELVQQHGIYRRLYERQFRDDAPQLLTPLQDSGDSAASG